MNEKDRLTNQLEQSAKRQFINFAWTDFGTTQEFLLYQHLSVQFDHSMLLIGIFPYNDFEDNDTSLHLNPYYKRFKPYFKGSAPDYHFVYNEDSIQKSNFNKQGFLKKRIRPGPGLSGFSGPIPAGLTYSLIFWMHGMSINRNNHPVIIVILQRSGIKCVSYSKKLGRSPIKGESLSLPSPRRKTSGHIKNRRFATACSNGFFM